MKPTSIIFIVVSVVLIISGFVTMGVANQLAASEGIEITAQKAEDSDNYIRTYDYSADYIGQININVSSAEVNIIGGSTHPYVEIINFPEGLYEFSHDDRKLTFSNNAELTDVSALTSLVTNFKGLRSLVNYFNMQSLPKKINVYLCVTDPMNSINITVKNGSVSLSDIDMAADYKIDIGNGELRASEVNTNSSVTAVIENGEVLLSECSIGTFTLTLENGDVNAKESIFDAVDARITAGDFSYECANAVELTNLNLYTHVGGITVNGETDDDGVYEQNYVLTENNVLVETGTGDINITYMPAAE